jgi:hypothetical protein
MQVYLPTVIPDLVARRAADDKGAPESFEDVTFRTRGPGASRFGHNIHHLQECGALLLEPDWLSLLRGAMRRSLRSRSASGSWFSVS